MAIQAKFASLLIAAGFPVAGALFIGDEVLPQHHLYFSPTAALIARHLGREYGGVQCAAPKQPEVGLFAGRAAAWKKVRFSRER